MRRTKKQITDYVKNELKADIRKAKTTYLRIAVSQARSNPKLAAHMWKCVNSVIGRDKSHMKGLPQGVSLDAINDFFSVSSN